MSRPLTKVDWVNLPLSIPREWQDYFDKIARTLGGSRNQVLCMALKLGGPTLGKYVQVMRSDLARQCKAIERVHEFPSEILGATALPENAGKIAPDERTNHKSNRTGSRKPGDRQKGR